jgi:hypothetical protein
VSRRPGRHPSSMPIRTRNDRRFRGTAFAMPPRGSMPMDMISAIRCSRPYRPTIEGSASSRDVEEIPKSRAAELWLASRQPHPFRGRVGSQSGGRRESVRAIAQGAGRRSPRRLQEPLAKNSLIGRREVADMKGSRYPGQVERFLSAFTCPNTPQGTQDFARYRA